MVTKSMPQARPFGGTGIVRQPPGSAGDLIALNPGDGAGISMC